MLKINLRKDLGLGICLRNAYFFSRAKPVFKQEQAYSQQLPAYLRTDIRIGFRKNKKKYTEEYGLDIQNMFNRKNVFSRSFNSMSGEVQNNYQVGIFPMGLYRITF